MDDELDKILYCKFESMEDVPEDISKDLKSVIHNKLYTEDKKKEKHYSIAKIITTVCASIMLTAGIAYASSVVSNKIWKQPEKVVGFYTDDEINSENIITEEQKSNVMSEKEAVEKANQILKKFNHEGEKIISEEIQGDSSNYELVWRLETDAGTRIRINAQNEEDFKISFLIEENIKKYRTTEQQAIQTAKELCKKYGYNPGEYEVTGIMKNINDSEEDSYIWTIILNKKYDGIKNENEAIHITFIPEINKIKTFIAYDKEYENNSVEITEEQAKTIALETETKIETGYQIKDTYVDLTIAQMNGDAYLRTTNNEQYYKQKSTEYPLEDIVEYRTENRVRKVWAVTIEYNLSGNEKIGKYYTYYVDTTTGEIIGGDEPMAYNKN